ncbi:unnamed protein product, partial [Pylaiella littoralis]
MKCHQGKACNEGMQRDSGCTSEGSPQACLENSPGDERVTPKGGLGLGSLYYCRRGWCSHVLLLLLRYYFSS